LITVVGPETVTSSERVPLRCSQPTNLGLKEVGSSSQAGRPSILAHLLGAPGGLGGLHGTLTSEARGHDLPACGH
jgi:hypothetical protein